MKNQLLTLLLVFVAGILIAQTYENNFTNDRLRLDMYHFGTDSTDIYSLKGFIKESPWSGPKVNLNDAPIHGSYILQVKNASNQELLFQTAYNTLFEEWQDTENAPHRTRIFEESLFIPYPKNEVSIEIFAHKEDHSLFKLWKTTFSPEKTWVESRSVEFYSEIIYGDENFENAVDVAIIAEGYTKDQMDDFREDANRMVEFFMQTKPFDEFKHNFNFYAVMSESKDSGADLPGEDIWKETAVDSRFYTFGSERYLTTLSYHKCMDAVSSIPHDQIIVLVNTHKYGGGGVFNHYSVTSADHFLSEIVLTHEFGHAFGGLADEYYTSSTAYVKHPDLKYELIDPNVTNLVDFDSKWKDMLEKDTPVPTPDTEEYDNTLGVFEGGRYLAKGIYRPVRDCRMKSNQSEFCPVCQFVLSDMIRFYCGMERKK